MSLKELAPTYFMRLQAVIAEVGESGRILNAGCGDGLFDWYLKNKVPEIVSFDINMGDICIARKLNPDENVRYCLGNMLELPFKTDAFDCIICVDVIEHVEDDTRAIFEMCRCLKEGGKFVITVPSKKFPFFYDPINNVAKRFGKRWPIGIWGWGHKRLYSTEEIVRKTSLELIRTEFLSKSFVGFVENSYLSSMLQRFTKTDPLNSNRTGKHSRRTERMLRCRIPIFFATIRDIIIKLDEVLCAASAKSIGIIAVFRK